MHKSIIAWLAVLLLCGGCAKRDAQRLTLTGSSTIAPLAQALASQFEQLHPGVKVDVQAGGSSRGVADARSGLAQIGMVSRALRADESDLSAFTIARDGIAIIVQRDNPVRQLSRAQIIGLYTGQLRDWSAVGGGAHAVTVVNKAEGRSTLELFLHHFDLKASAIRADVVIGENQQGIKTVAGNAGAIGYVSIGTAEYEAAHGGAIKLLPMDGVVASTPSVRDGSFPLARPLNLVTRPQPTGLSKQFIDFAMSRAAHDAIVKEYFVPIAGN
ncbi:MAG: phosphate ABC transporter substrate-binding protein [Pseudomonadota bacterium]